MTSGREAARLLKFWLSVLLVACTGAATAADSAWGVETLMQSLAQIKSSKAKFVERKHLRILNAPLELSGTLLYSAPARLEKRTLQPKPELLVLDGDTLTVEDARKRRRVLTLQQYPVVWTFVEAIRGTLAGDLQSLRRFYRVRLDGTERDWRLTLEPLEANVQRFVSQIRLAGDGNVVRTIEILEAEGDRSIMTISEER